MRKELGPSFVERGHAGVATAGDVQRRQIQWQPHQIVAQGSGHKLVNLIADLAGHAADDLPGCDRRRYRTVLVEFHRVQEGLNQTHLLCTHCAGVRIHHLVACIEAVHRLSEHGVPEAVHHVSKLCHDGWVQVGGCRKHKGVDGRLHFAPELFKHQVLVLHFRHKSGGLKKALAIPVQGGYARRSTGDLGHSGQVGHQPFVDDGQASAGQDGLLVGLHQPVVLGVKHRVNGGQANVLIAAAVTGDVVTVQQFVVVSARWLGCSSCTHCGVKVSGFLNARCGGIAIVVKKTGRGVVGNVVQKSVRRAQGVGRCHRCGGCSLHHDVVRRVGDTVCADTNDDLRETVGAGNEFSVGVGAQQRHVQHIKVVQFNAQHGAGLRLDFGPVGNPAVSAVEQVARGRGAGGRHFVFAQKHLVRCVGRVGLVLVDERRGGVDRLVGLVIRRAHEAVGTCRGDRGGTRQCHEVGSTRHIQRIVGLQGNVDRAVASLGNQVQTMVKKLPEQGHPAIEGRR